MNKKICLMILLAIFLTGIFAGQNFVKAQTQAPSPHWPSARAMLWLGAIVGTDTDQKADYSWEAQHYDVIISMSADYVDYIRSINPTILGPGTYEQFIAALAGSKQEKAIQDQATRLGLNAEDAYVHLKKDTVSRLTSSTNVSQTYPWLKWDPTTQKVTIPGWDPANDRNGDGYVDDTEFANLANPNATARSRNQARWSDWSWNPPQWKLNLGAFDLVKALIDLIASTKLAFANFTIIGFDGVDGYYGFGSSFHEYPHTTGGNPDTEYASDMAALIRYTKQLYGGQVLIFGNSCGGNWIVDQELDGSYRELYLSTYWTCDGWETGVHPFSSTSPYYLARQAGKIQGLQMQYNTLGAGDTPQNWVRERIFGVASYYLLQNPGKDYWAGWNSVAYWPDLTNNEKMWSHALEVDIGQPTGHTPNGATIIAPWGVWVFATGADPGHPNYPDITKSRYKIYAREYTKGLVLLKPRAGTATTPGTLADNTSTTHDLPVTADNPTGRYFLVSDNGSIGTTPLTTVTLRNGEAAIFVYFTSCSSQGGNICQATQLCSGNWTAANDTNYCCLGTCYYDTTAPIISNVQATPSITSAVITWTTNENSSSIVRYGTLSGIYPYILTGASGTSHSVMLSSLQSNTTYYYVANSTDPNGNSAQSSQQSFRTFATGAVPTISFVSPTPANNAQQSSNYVYVNTAVSGAGNLTAFINWNRSLLGYWNLNNNTADLSGYGNNGSMIGNVNCASNVSGKFGTGCSFDGTATSWMNLTPSAMRGLINFTVEVWMKSSDTTKTGTLIHATNTIGANVFIIFNYKNITIYVKDSSWVPTPNVILNDGTWHHVAVTRNESGHVRLYVDGVFKGTGSLPTGNLTVDCLVLAQEQDALCGGFDANQAFLGTMDEIRIFNRALNDQEINASYNASAYRLFRNFTNLADATYSYYAYITDSNGNAGQTETRTVIVNSSYVPATCNLTSASISPQCGAGASTDCEPGETILMNGIYTGDCSQANFFQIDAKSSDGLCAVEYSTGNMSGIWSATPTISAGIVNGTWTVPSSIPNYCRNKTISATWSSLFSGLPSNVTWVTSSAATGSFKFYSPTCTENWQCTQWSTCVGGSQARTCTDLNNCGTILNKPAESQSCTAANYSKLTVRGRIKKNTIPVQYCDNCKITITFVDSQNSTNTVTAFNYTLSDGNFTMTLLPPNKFGSSYHTLKILIEKNATKSSLQRRIYVR